MVGKWRESRRGFKRSLEKDESRLPNQHNRFSRPLLLTTSAQTYGHPDTQIMGGIANPKYASWLSPPSIPYEIKHKKTYIKNFRVSNWNFQ